MTTFVVRHLLIFCGPRLAGGPAASNIDIQRSMRHFFAKIFPGKLIAPNRLSSADTITRLVPHLASRGTENLFF